MLARCTYRQMSITDGRRFPTRISIHAEKSCSGNCPAGDRNEEESISRSVYALDWFARVKT